MKFPAVLPARILALICCAMLSTFLTAQNVANPQQFITQARGAYYSLSEQGVTGFQCSATPDWEKLLQAERAENPAAADTAIKFLRQIQFVVKEGADGTVKLTHNDVAGNTKEMNDALAQIYGGMEQMTSGFFDTWKLFMLNRPLPEPASQYQLQSGGALYLLNYKENNADVATTMNKDFAISELKVTTSEFDSNIHPEFTRTPQGFVLSSYDAHYEESKNSAVTTQLQVLIDYQEVARVQMLRKLSLSGTYGGTPFAVDVAFSDCQITRKTLAN